jgi:hypothetical protein
LKIEFNGGAGAVLCEICGKILHEDFSKKQWELLNKMRNIGDVLICKGCSESVETKKVKRNVY